jgi:hypothetical protein
MKYAPLPFIQSLEGLRQTKPDHAEEVLKQTIKAFFGSDAAQILASRLRDLEGEAMEAIASGSAVERNVGRLSVIKDIRDSYAALLPDSDKDQAEMLEEEAVEEFAVPVSDFLIPYPEPHSGEEGE